jgi:heme-degrading monooxygenase HmoA
MYSAAFIYKAGEYDADFHALNDAIDQMARSSSGFLGSESWVSADGATRNATYYWADLETLRAFSKHPKHLEAKRQYQRWYSGFQVVISEVIRSYGAGAVQHVTARGTRD